jgi:transposase
MDGTYTEVRNVPITVQFKYVTLASAMNEQFRRRWAGCEALAMGRGGVSAVAAATGMSRNTVLRGIAEIQEHLPELAGRIGQERIRRPGGGRRARAAEDASLLSDLRALLESSTRGDPTSPLLWTAKSTRKLAEELVARGHAVSHMTVDRLLGQLGYSLQANRKTREGELHPDRNGQFEHLNAKVRRFQRRGEPVVSVDTKKRELLGDFRNPGREWHPQGQPDEVRIHDFRDKTLGVAIPYGVYDTTRHEGWVSVGIDHDTAEFAVASIRRWWQQMGRHAYRGAKELLITADSGGSNGSRVHLWKWCLQKLADETQLRISVCHFPPGTSKWNKIEHQMFCHIAENWRGRPLVSRSVIVSLIGHTTTREGLRIEAALDKASYKQKIKISDEQMASLRLSRDAFHGDWNYRLDPRPPS